MKARARYEHEVRWNKKRKDLVGCVGKELEYNVGTCFVLLDDVRVCT